MVKFSRAALRAISSLEDEFANITFKLFRQGKMPKAVGLRNRRMVGWIGATPSMLARAWYLLEDRFDNDMPRGATKERFLWGLYRLKAYDNDHNNAARCGAVDEKTFAKWSWWFLEELSFLEDEVVRYLLFLFAHKE